ncbi:MAG: nitroreductase [Gammaproteobacteria bacterium]|nr:nitroreductase [Gammaproteobacteria bacterium]
MNDSDYISYDKSLSVTDAINTRRSLRAFLPEDVPNDVVRSILTTAARAPSGTNMQPWEVYVLKGDTLKAVSESVCAAFDNPDIKPSSETQYYPTKWFEPYLARRRKVGWDLYGLLDIKKGDREKTHKQHKRNYEFFDAPLGMMFTIHKELATGSWLDYGMFLQNIMLLAREAGLHTCPQAAWPDYHTEVRKVLNFTPEEVLVCGMTMGYANPDAIENTLVTDRVPVDEFVRFLD